PEHFLNSFSFLLTDLVSRMPGSPPVDGAATATLLVLCDMRCHFHAPHLFYEVLGVISFVGANRHALGAFQSLRHEHRRIALRRAVTPQQLGIYHQPMAVLDQYIAAVGQLGFMPAALAR